MVAALAKDLRRVPELFAQLDVTITRTDVTRPRGGGAHGAGGERPLILDDRASERRRSLLRMLRHAAAPVPYAPRALSPRDAALAILRDLPRTSGMRGAEVWMRTLLAEFTRAWGAVDAPAPLMFAGRCEGCGRSIAGPEYRRTIRCRRCGGKHDARQHRTWMQEAAEDRTGTAAELSALMPHFEGSPVRAASIRKWHERGRLIGCVEERGTTFRLGDVLALHRARRARLRPVDLAA
ncbi:hypothetical protein IU433_14085 [Nocardia puris]|uniref:hypothetical protein n=1 Tax=Nocardia puris TaxID=208602 RepID=UPI001894151A|nr:hypothetical protein [Nocardia puris]MBF6460166.1 hypothetical protein [Nocardia puris]